MIYFDNAATSGRKPPDVINSVEHALRYISANPGRSGHKISSRAAEAVYNTRNKISNMFGASGPEQVIFTANCTQSINYVLKGLVNKDDFVITSDIEHNAVMRPLVKTGAEYETFTVSFSNDASTVEAFKEKLRNNVKLVICTAASNVFGKTVPLYEIGKICHENNILFAVDAAQGAGVLPIDMKKMNIDFLCIAPHKGLYAPMGTGILIAQKPIPNTVIEGGTGTDSINLNQPEIPPERFESGTVNLPGIAGISAGADFVSRNEKFIYQKEMRIISEIYKGLSETENIVFYTPQPQNGLYVPVLSFNIEGINSQQVSSILDKKGIAVRAGLHCAPAAHKKAGTIETGTVRISPSVYNTLKEADIFIETVKKIAKNKKYYIE